MLHVYNDIILPCDGMGLLGYLWERKLFHLGASSVANAEGREKAAGTSCDKIYGVQAEGMDG